MNIDAMEALVGVGWVVLGVAWFVFTFVATFKLLSKVFGDPFK